MNGIIQKKLITNYYIHISKKDLQETLMRTTLETLFTAKDMLSTVSGFEND